MSHHRAAGRLGAFRSWANTVDRSARTGPARRRSPASIEYHLDRLPAEFDGLSEEARRAAAEAAKTAHFLELADRSRRARSSRTQHDTEKDIHEMHDDNPSQFVPSIDTRQTATQEVITPSPPAPPGEMVRPHDLRPGDVIRVAGELRTVSSRPMPQVSDRRHRLVVTTDAGLVSWSVAEATFPQVERVARADRQAVA